ncbi:MAG: SUMF1/EgtB/PvdO family nonheme iron enzyme, partial [Deltaproteobacteria bacterium]|nr:SUMF1/EgtB/PvdO family nonheme iron enzyme [Deltaproteobacteria bacterium]
MKKAVLLIVSLILSVSISAVEVHAHGWAVLVGIDEYNHKEITPLMGAANDVVSLSKTLQQALGMPEEQILVYTHGRDSANRPSTGNIVKALQYVASKAKSDDLFVFSFSGHGISAGNESYLLTYYSEMGALQYTALGVTQLTGLLNDIKAEKKLIFIDACRNNPERGKGGESNLLSDAFAKGIVVKSNGPIPADRMSATLFSCEIGQRSYEWPEKRRGFFSYYLEQGLKGEASDAKGVITLGGLVSYLRQEVPDAVQRHLGVDKLQRPYVRMQGGDPGNMVLQRISGKDWDKILHERQAQLDILNQKQQDQDAARQRQEREEAEFQSRISDLDAKIRAMKDRLGTSAQQSDDSLDAMLAMVKQKEEQQKRLDALQRQREEEEAQRREEMARLKAEEMGKRIAALREDIRKYNEIISSPFGKDMKEAAWKTLVAKHPEAGKGVRAGDTEGLLFQGSGGVVNSLGMKFVYIFPGTFTMGSPANEKDRDDNELQHQVTLTKGFYMQTTEVTQGQWKDVMGNNPSYFKNCGDDCPLESISWNDAQEFINRLNRKEGAQKYRLPTEAEWEYACRAGSTTRFYFGDSESDLGEYAWYDGNSGGKTHPLAQKRPNAWGLYDMHGNVWEWCEDWYGETIHPGSVTDPIGASGGSYRVLRGGSW